MDTLIRFHFVNCGERDWELSTIGKLARVATGKGVLGASYS
jgi:hypothetical protein